MKKRMLMLMGLMWVSSVVYAAGTPIEIKVLSVNEPIDIGNSFSLQVQITNTSEADEEIKYQCCKGGHPWRFEYPSISVVGGTYNESCEFSPCQEDFTLKPGESRTVDLEIVMAEKTQEADIDLEVGFAYQGEVYWSLPVTVEVNESLGGDTFQDEP